MINFLPVFFSIFSFQAKTQNDDLQPITMRKFHGLMEIISLRQADILNNILNINY